MKNKQAFTLIELLVVVLIIGILAAVALPQYKKAVLKSRFATIKDLTHSLAQAEEIYYLANGEYITNLEALDMTLPPGNPAHEISSETRAQRLWNWGKCVVTKTYVACEIQKDLAKILGYQIYLNHSGAPQTWCVAQSDDLNAPVNKICQAETGKTAPYEAGSGTGYKVWVY